MKNKKILALGTMYLDINCIDFPFDKGLFVNRETVGNNYQYDLGGSALNFAKVASQLQLTISLVGKVGTDPISAIVLSLLRQNKITPHLIADTSVQTNLAIHYIHTTGDSIMTSCGNANQSLSFQDIERKIDPLLDSIEYVYIGGIFKLKHVLPHLTTLAKKVKGKNIKIVLDHGRINNTVSVSDRNYLMEVFPYVDIYLPSIDEFLAVWKSKTMEEGFVKLSKVSSALTIVKQAENGALGFDKGIITSVDPYKVTVRNTVGAGDSFNAGFLKAHMDGMSLKESIQYGCAVAAIKISTKERIMIDDVETLMRR